MRFIVKDKVDRDGYYVITLGNREDEDRYSILGQEFEFLVSKGGRFKSAEKNGFTPEEDNQRWFDSFEIGGEFNLSPSETQPSQASMKPTLSTFEALWFALECKGSAKFVYEKLVSYYESSCRHYHTLEHVYWGLKRARELAEARLYPDEEMLPVYWAMWFHDMCMSFHQRDSANDEELSATLASVQAERAGLNKSFQEQVYRLVMATAHLKPPRRDDEAIMVDADLSMLGAERSAFIKYEELVRKEWSHVSEPDFCRGRERVLSRFADMPRSFTTDTAYNLWEANARSNIEWSRARLASRLLTTR
jgi:predicted metal-dependent HD superfamily phosphohydrolase